MSNVALPAEDDGVLTERREGEEVILLVKGATSPHSLSGALLNYIREGQLRIIARAIGAGAVNQAAKGCAIARALAKQEGYEVTFALEFTSITIKGEGRTAICFIVQAQHV
jgi:stage V sporulation protein SpoVS